MGSVCRTALDKRHLLRIEVYPPDHIRLGRVEILGKHRTILAYKDNFPGGMLRYELPGRTDPGYVVVRAFGAGDDPDLDPDHVKYAAVSNPVYMWPQNFQVKPPHTACTFHVGADSRWNGGSLQFQTTDGQLIRREEIHQGVIRALLPADARVVLAKTGLKSRMFYIAMENAAVEKNLSYLVYGEFRKDYPDLKEGVVPPAAFHLLQLQRALGTFDYELK
jgi:hypothetical protein